jgi:NitT/TauT family transport system ATP-binding protein
MASAPKVSVRNMTKEFQTRAGQVVTALQSVSLDLAEGTFLSIVGPSGCGKTTLLRIIAGLEEQTTGTLDVRRSTTDKPLNSMVFQEKSILPWMTVRENVAYGLRMRGVPRAIQREVSDHFIALVGLTKFSDAYPHQLSGGMKQRVSIARAFANDPEILLMDEPFSALDEQNKILLQQELVRLWETTRKTVIYITHSIDEAINLSDRVMVMTARPGRIKEWVDVDLPRPRDVYQVRDNPQFMALFHRIWGALRDEVLRTKEEEGLQLAHG